MEHFIVSEISRHGYLAIFVLMTLESACIPIPSEAIMLFGGALTAGVTIAGVTGHLNVVAVGLLGVAGNLVGSIMTYYLGRTGGRALIDKWGRYMLLRHKDLDRAEAFFKKRGEVAVLVGRILPVVRTFISLPAGIAEMPIYRFALFTLLGCLPWVFALTYIGRSVAGNWQTISSYFTPISLLFGIVIVGALVWWYIKRRRTFNVSENS